MRVWGLLLLAWVSVAGAASPTLPVSQSPVQSNRATANPVVDIQGYSAGLAGVRAANSDVHLSVESDPSFPDERVLIVEYPVPTGDPAGRDVQVTAEHHDWTAGRAIAFHIKPAHPMRLSVSFLDRNGVAYTAWTELKDAAWQSVVVPFAEIRPNPYFQPPGAKVGAPIDVSDVKWIAFAPQDRTAGRLAVSKFVVSK
jgi:hypothetical protein